MLSPAEMLVDVNELVHRGALPRRFELSPVLLELLGLGNRVVGLPNFG